MKRTLLLATLLWVSAASLQAQFTLRLAGGYAWPGFQTSEGISGPVIDPLNPGVDALGPLANMTDTINGKPATYKQVKDSYGHGMNFTLGLGYTVNKYFNFELGISYLKSVTISGDQTRQLVFTGGGGGPQYQNAYLFAHITTNAFGISISPAFTVQAPIKNSKFMPYVRAGLSMPIYGGLTDHITITQNSGTQLLASPYYLGNKTEVTLKTQGAASLGFNGAIGVKYNVLPFLSIFAEVNGQYLITRAKSSKITQWDADGVSMLGNDTTVDRRIYRTQFNYVSQLNGNSNNAQYNPNGYSKDKPKDDVMPTGTFSNLGINIGVTFNLGKKTLKKNSAKEAATK